MPPWKDYLLRSISCIVTITTCQICNFDNSIFRVHKINGNKGNNNDDATGKKSNPEVLKVPGKIRRGNAQRSEAGNRIWAFGVRSFNPLLQNTIPDRAIYNIKVK